MLIVEDDPNDVLLLDRALTRMKEKCPFHILSKSEEVMEYFYGRGKYSCRENFPIPDLMLVDVRLAGFSGFDILRWVRNHPEIQRLPVILWSSSCEAAEVGNAYHLGANSFLTKPVDFTELQKLMTRLHSFWCARPEHPDFPRGRNGSFESC